VGESRPDLTFVLDLPAEEGLARAKARRGDGAADRFEGEKLEFHRALREAFRAIAAQDPRRCVLVDASRHPDQVAADVWREVEARLLARPAAA
jgi:dTMP kinase